MKNIALLFIAFLLLQPTTQAQDGWFEQTSGTTAHLEAVSFTDSDNGTVVGRDGTILRTTNGGTTWIQQLSGTTELLYGVSFTDSDNGTAVGDSGTILRTTDGGTTWTSQTSGTTEKLRGVSFTDSDNGTAVGESGTILRTTDGGTTWTSQTSGTTENLRGVSFTDSENGTAVGNYESEFGIILRTTDGGTTWTQQMSGIGILLTAVSFTDSANGTATAVFGEIIRTTDGGTTWTFQATEFDILANGVSFTDVNNGTVVGWDYSFNGRALILRTTDGGNTWTKQSCPTNIGLRSVSFTDSDNGTVVGGNGRILRTTTGGVIPVELTTFTASTSNGKATLNWTTATETNNQMFEIERRIEDRQFTTIGYVEGHGTTTETQNYQFIDDISDIQATSLSYRLKQIDYDGSYEYSDVVEVTNPAPTDYALHQNFPNPYNPTTTITYSLPVKAQVTLIVYNTLGESVVQLVNEEKDAGRYKVELNATALPSGIYFYRLRAGDFVETKKMVLMK